MSTERRPGYNLTTAMALQRRLPFMTSTTTRFGCRVMPGVLLVLASSLTAAAEAPQHVELRDGDHVVFIGDTFADLLRNEGYLETMLTLRHSGRGLVFRNLGWAGDTLSLQPRPLNFGSLDEHLAEAKADAIIACFGMSASFDGADRAEAFADDWRGFIAHLNRQKYNGRSPPRLVMVTPIAHEPLDPKYGDAAAHNQVLAKYVAAMKQVAGETGVPLVDVFSLTSEISKRTDHPPLTTNGIHLNAYGQWLVGRHIADSIGPARPTGSVSLDVAENRGEAAGAQIVELRRGADGWRLQLHEEQLPDPPPPGDAGLSPGADSAATKLVVRNLPPGRYSISIDGVVSLEADAAALAQGVAVSRSPRRAQAERLRGLINHKNELFFHRWRPANGEYVFGRRAKPFGVVSFPPEMERFDQLIAEKDAQIHRLSAPPEEQSWQIAPVK